jgi:predicted AAA+ superfamily ATPase
MGAKLEVDVYNRLADLFFEEIYHERDLVRIFGWECGSVDILIITGDYIIPIQLKWRKSKRRETHGIINFIKSVQYIKNKLKKKVLFGVWSSRVLPFEDNQCCLDSENVKCVACFESIDRLAAATVDFICCEMQTHRL